MEINRQEASSRAEGFQKSLEEGDKLAEIMENEGIQMPSMSTINEGLSALNLKRKEASIGWADDVDAEENQKEEYGNELDDLMNDTTPVLLSREQFTTPPQSKPPRIEEFDTPEKDEEAEYEESFASQRETAQLREEMEMFAGRMTSLEQTVNAVMKEREALPSHLTAIREDVNRQFTLMLEKLHAALESESSTANIQAASASIREVQNRTSDQLAAAADYASDRPRENSPIATKGAKLEGKRRFRPVK